MKTSARRVSSPDEQGRASNTMPRHFIDLRDHASATLRQMLDAAAG